MVLLPTPSAKISLTGICRFCPKKKNNPKFRKFHIIVQLTHINSILIGKKYLLPSGVNYHYRAYLKIYQ